MSPDQQLKLKLSGAGYDESAITAVWPAWWSEEASDSPVAQAELRITVAKKLGLDPQKLLEHGSPQFVWKGESKYKHLRGETEWEKDAVSSYGIAIGRILAEAIADRTSIKGADPGDLRQYLSADKGYVDLADLIAFCWGVGIPVIHLRVFPLKQKRMSAMCVKTSDGFAILMAKDSYYPASTAFHLAHEVAHIALGHLDESEAILDFDDIAENDRSDSEEQDADRYALHLLTGMPNPRVESTSHKTSAAQLADNVLRSGPQLGIEPGMLALCFGYTTGLWPVSFSALSMIYSEPRPVWKEINMIAQEQLIWSQLSESDRDFLENIMLVDRRK